MYFEKTKNLDELKKKYRELAFANHPDRGGDTATMQAINAEYDLMHASLLNVWAGGSQKEESGADFRRSFYEEQDWTGERYNRDLSMDAITKIIRAYCKSHFPDCKFSVTRKDYNSITVALMEAPFEAIRDDVDDYCKKYRYTQHISSGTEEAQEILKDIEVYGNSYNFDYSDIQTDYFHRNFYFWLQIGKWDKPFTVNTKRIKRSRGKDIKAA